MFGLAHRAVLLAPAEDAFGHCPTRLRQAAALVPRGTSIDGALAALAGCGDAVVLCHMRRDVEGTQIGHMIGGVIGLAFATMMRRLESRPSGRAGSWSANCRSRVSCCAARC